MFGAPSILFGKLLPPQIRGHALRQSVRTSPVRQAQSAHSQRRRIIRVIRNGIGQSQGSVRTGVPGEECDCPIHARRLVRVNHRWNLQQRFEHKWRQRLTGAQHAIGAAVPSAIVGLLAPEILDRSRQRSRGRLRAAGRCQ
jgi:hypothetical protein